MKKYLIFILLLGMLVTSAGCDRFKWKAPAKDAGADLIYVQIVFDNGDKLNTYVKDIGVSEDTTVYSGGITNSKMYDSRGNVVGVFNYNRVHYMTVVAPQPQ